MPNIAAVLKEEIARIARKEIRADTSTLQKASAQYRRDIAALKRRIDELEKALRKASKGIPAGRANAKIQQAGDVNGLRFRAGGLASHRKRLALSAEDFGKLVGVSGQTIYAWESGKSRPRRSQLAAIAAARRLGKREAAARLAA